MALQIFKIMRVARILKLMKNIEGIRRLYATLSFSLPSLINATSLVFLSYYIFSILASNLFNKYDSKPKEAIFDD